VGVGEDVTDSVVDSIGVESSHHGVGVGVKATVGGVVAVLATQNSPVCGS
jgi:hypothetical protein